MEEIMLSDIKVHILPFDQTLTFGLFFYPSVHFTDNWKTYV